MGANTLLRRKKKQGEIYSYTIKFTKSKLQLIQEYMDWKGESLGFNNLPIMYFDKDLGEMKTIRLALTSRKDGFYIKPTLLDSSGNQFYPDVLVTLPDRKEQLDDYRFEWKGEIFELRIAVEG